MNDVISGAVDCAMVFGSLFAVMFLPVLMFKRAFHSKKDVDYLDVSKFVPVPDPTPSTHHDNVIGC